MKSILSKVFILLSLFVSIVWYGCRDKKEDPKPIVYNFPTLSETKAASAIEGNSAMSGGTVSADGGISVLSRGLCWNTTGNPTIADKISANASGLGSFDAKLRFLYPNTTYFVKAYAVNKAGVGYGPETSFKTPVIPGICKTDTALAVDTNSARLGGVVTDGGLPFSNYGICYSERINPTTQFADSIYSFGKGQGKFSAIVKGFKPFKIYYFRAFAINETGTNYGEEYSFKTKDLLPRLITTEASNVFSDSVTLGGTVTYSGGDELLVRGVCWSFKTNPEASNAATRRAEQTKNTGTFSFKIKAGITPDTIWYARAYARTRTGLMQYGQNITFTTPKRIPLISNVNSVPYSDSARINFRIDPGRGKISQMGVYYSLNANPSSADNVALFPNPAAISGITTVKVILSGLSAGTKYYFKPFATNQIGTKEGPELSFTTLSIPPVVKTSEVSNIVDTTATAGGEITNSGNPVYTERGVCFDTTASPTISQNLVVSPGTGTGSFTVPISGLARGKTYYVRAYAKHSTGVVYGEEKSFVTGS
jgi:hypothetical protein